MKCTTLILAAVMFVSLVAAPAAYAKKFEYLEVVSEPTSCFINVFGAQGRELKILNMAILEFIRECQERRREKGDQVTNVLNLLGKQGWELVAGTRVALYLKRRLK